jgi:anti-anti-sigma factor
MTLTGLAQPTASAAAPPAALVASVSADGTATVVAFRGEADLFTLPVVIDVLARVIADSDGPVIVDLADTEFMDTAAVRALERAWQFLDDRGRALTLRSPCRLARRVLTLLGLSHLLEPDGITAA